MVDFTKEFYDSLPRTSSTSYDSCSTDEGYFTDEKPPPHEQQQQQQQHSEIPILKSNRIIYISYSNMTYTLSILIILLTIYTLLCQPFPWGHTFPPVFELFHLLFHACHLFAHEFNLFQLERLCVIYGTWLYWTGWLLGRLLFSERLAVQSQLPATVLIFWLLMIERRNAWGILVWEFTSKLSSKQWELASFRIWSLLGTGSFWALLYIGLAKLDGYAFKYLLQFHHIIKMLLVSTLGGFIMIVFWSFWTFQYKGVLWQIESRKGIIVWYSEGVAHAAKVI